MRSRVADISRLEAFSDAVFAFALTLLVVSLEVPRSYDELIHTMRNFIGFAASFAALIWIWFQHYSYFRRYGLSDPPTIVLNAILLFVVLLYVYPLKFLTTFVFDQLLDPASAAPLSPRQSSDLVLIYSGGYVAVFLVFLLMHLYAYRQRHALHLNRLELFDTRYAIESNVINVGVGAASMALAAVGAPSAVAGLVYLALGPIRAIHGARSGRRRRGLEPR